MREYRELREEREERGEVREVEMDVRCPLSVDC